VFFDEKMALGLKKLRPPTKYSSCPLFFVMMLRSHLFIRVHIFIHGICQCKVSSKVLQLLGGSEANKLLKCRNSPLQFGVILFEWDGFEKVQHFCVYDVFICI